MFTMLERQFKYSIFLIGFFKKRSLLSKFLLEERNFSLNEGKIGQKGYVYLKVRGQKIHKNSPSLKGKSLTKGRKKKEG